MLQKNFARKNGSISKNLEQAKLELGNPSLIIFLAGYDEFKEYSTGLKNIFPDANIIGTTGISFLDNQCLNSGISITVFYEEIISQVGVLKEIDKYPLKYIKNLRDAVYQVGVKEQSTICFEFCTAYEERLVSTMNVVLEKNNIPLIGGTTSNTPADCNKLVSCNGEIYQNACVFAVIKNMHGVIKVVKENIFSPLQERYVATKVDTKNRILYELNGKKAWKTYADAFDTSMNAVQGMVLTNPLCRTIGEEHFICAIQAFNEDGSLSMYKNIHENDTIQVMNIEENYKNVMINTMNRAKEELDKISGILSINCILRYLFFEKENFISEYASFMSSVGTHFGMVSDGEQFINQHINQSMVCAIFE